VSSLHQPASMSSYWHAGTSSRLDADSRETSLLDCAFLVLKARIALEVRPCQARKFLYNARYRCSDSYDAASVSLCA
jgi:hypothetical protein